MPTTSFIICSVDAIRFRSISLAIQHRMAGREYEIVGVHDARGMCEGYNRGVTRAKGEHLVFCHDDIDMLSPHFADRLERHLQAFDLVGVAGTDRLVSPIWTGAGPPHIFGQVAHFHEGASSYTVDQYGVPRRVIENIQAMDGLFLAARRQVLEKVRFDEETFRGWHMYDIDFTYGAFLAGLRLAVCCDLQLFHASPGKFDQSWVNDGELFMNKHRHRLPAGPKRAFNHTAIAAADKAEALELMEPWWWDSAVQPPRP